MKKLLLRTADAPLGRARPLVKAGRNGYMFFMPDKMKFKMAFSLKKPRAEARGSSPTPIQRDVLNRVSRMSWWAKQSFLIVMRWFHRPVVGHALRKVRLNSRSIRLICSFLDEVYYFR